MFGFLILVAFVLLTLSLVAYNQTRPSGDIEKYSKYYVNDTSLPTEGQIKVTFFGVSTLLFDDGETQILLDGFFTRYGLLKALTKRLRSDTAAIDRVLKENEINRVRGIFVTHSHYDHAFDVAYVTKQTGTTLYGSVSTLNIARGGDVAEQQLQLFSPNEDFQLGKFTIRVVPSIHSPGNALDDNNVVIDKPIRQPAKMTDYSEGGSYDFFIQHNGHSIYVKPSPNFIEGALDSLHADVLFLGIATVTKHPEDWQTKFYQHTVGALKPSVLVPLHWDNFLQPMSDHLEMLPRFANTGEKDFDYFIKKLDADHIDFKVLQGSKSIILF